MDVDPVGDRDTPTVDAAGAQRRRVEGVVRTSLTPKVDHRGSLTEVVNFDDAFWEEPVVYAYCFTILPGKIKGWGMHTLQTDRYFLVSGSIRVVLYDGRVGSPTQGNFEQHNLTGSARGLLRIPPGVWHADQNWGDDEAVVMNFPTEPYSRESPDKYRIDPHSGEIPFDWELRDG